MNNYFSKTFFFSFEVWQFKFCKINYILQQHGFLLIIVYCQRLPLHERSPFSMRNNNFFFPLMLKPSPRIRVLHEILWLCISNKLALPNYRFSVSKHKKFYSNPVTNQLFITSFEFFFNIERLEHLIKFAIAILIIENTDMKYLRS